MNINIEINDIVLNGVDFGESQALELRQALRKELAGFVASHAALSSRFNSFSTGAAEIESATNPSPRDLASGLARSIGQSMHGQQS